MGLPLLCGFDTLGGMDEFRTSSGEVVRRLDLDRAARKNPRVAGYEGIALARAALAGDQAALDEFHGLAGLVLPDVTEHGELQVVRLGMDGTHHVFIATNQGGYDSTAIDANGLVAWICSPQGRAALARRGIVVPPAAETVR
jgi:hypothetical protein